MKGSRKLCWKSSTSAAKFWSSSASRKTPAPAIPVKRLQDDVSVLFSETGELSRIPGYQVGRHQVDELGDEELFGRIANLARVVHDERSRMDLLEKMRRRDVVHVERRILPHQHDIEGALRPWRLERRAFRRGYRLSR